ncbi:nucleoside diphosphate kinase 6 isoform X5 [Phascolarctos cinereus]
MDAGCCLSGSWPGLGAPGPQPWLLSFGGGVLPGHSPADPEQPAPHCANSRPCLEAGGLPAVLPGACSGPIRAYILAHKDAVQLWRTLMGPTRVFRARHVAPDSIRGSFGLTDTRNTTHGSDSVVSARREIAAFFPDFSERRWYAEEEPMLRLGPVYYDAEGGVHCVARGGEASGGLEPPS